VEVKVPALVLVLALPPLHLVTESIVPTQTALGSVFSAEVSTSVLPCCLLSF
jgi:hypothetical protein